MKRILIGFLFLMSVIPTFSQSVVPINPEEIRRRYIEAVGGVSAIQGIKDIKLVYRAEVQGTKLSYTEWKSEGRIRKEVSVMGNIYQLIVYANGKARTLIQGQPREVTAEELAQLRRDADIQAILHPEKYGMKRQFVRQEKVDTMMFNVVDVSDGNGAKSVEYYDDNTGLLVREGLTQNSSSGPISVIVAYGDFREVPGSGGYKIPYSLRQGSMSQEMEFILVDVEVNKGLKADVFE